MDPSAAALTDPFDQWLAAERHAALVSMRPARTETVTDTDDPFRTVLFDDFRSLLFVLHSPQSHLQLVYAFLTFCGLPFTPDGVPSNTLFAQDSFIHCELVYNASTRAKFWPTPQAPTKQRFATIEDVPMELERQVGMRTPFSSPFKIIPTSFDVLFAKPDQWFTLIEPGDLNHLDCDLVT